MHVPPLRGVFAYGLGVSPGVGLRLGVMWTEAGGSEKGHAESRVGIQSALLNLLGGGSSKRGADQITFDADRAMRDVRGQPRRRVVRRELAHMDFATHSQLPLGPEGEATIRDVVHGDGPDARRHRGVGADVEAHAGSETGGTSLTGVVVVLTLLAGRRDQTFDLTIVDRRWAVLLTVRHFTLHAGDGGSPSQLKVHPPPQVLAR